MGCTLLCQLRSTPSDGMTRAALPTLGHAIGSPVPLELTFNAFTWLRASGCNKGNWIPMIKAAATTPPSTNATRRARSPRETGLGKEVGDDTD